MPATVMNYPFDKTGVSPGNKIQGEAHTLVNRSVRAIVPDYGAFFSKSLRVFDTNGNTELQPGTQFRAIEPYPLVTQQWGKEVCAAILILDPNVSNNVTITYQVLGGEQSYSKKAILERFAAISLERHPDWKTDIIAKPTGYKPAPHLHDAVTVFGFEYLRDVMQRIRAAIGIGDDAVHSELRSHIDRVVNSATDDSSVVIDDMLAAHITAPHPHSQYVRLSDLAITTALVKKPINTTPAGGAANVALNSKLTGSPYYSFYGVGQKSAQFQVSTNSSFSTLVVDKTVVGAVTEVQPDAAFLTNTVYYWRYRYRDNDDVWSEWSTVTSFNTSGIAVSRPTITSPVNEANTNTETPTITGSAFSVAGGVDVHYMSDWEVRTGPNGTGALIFSVVSSTSNKTSITIPPATLQQNRKYYVRVRYRGNVYGYSNWSPDVAFNAVWIGRPKTIGEAYGGGYFAGDVIIAGSTYAVVVAPKAVGETQNALVNTTAQTNNTSLVDSVANTAALPNTACAAFVKTLTIGGYTDWVIPAANIQRLIWQNLRTTSPYAPAAFKVGGVEAFGTGYYWTSTAYDWIDEWQDDPSPVYGQVAHKDCNHTASAWYAPSSAESPTAVCAVGTVSDVTHGYVFGTNPSTGQPGSFNSTNWCCNWTSTEIVSYAPGAYYQQPYYDAVLQSMSQADVQLNKPKTSSYSMRAVRLVKVA